MGSISLSFVFLVVALFTSFSKANLLLATQTPSLLIDRLKNISGKQLDTRKVLLVSLLGFDAEDSAANWKTLITEGIQQQSHEDDGAVAIESASYQALVEIAEISGASTLDEALSYGGGDVVVVYAGNVPNIAWQSHLQALVDANQGPLTTPMSVVVLVDDIHRKEVQKAVDIVLQNAAYTDKSVVEVTYLSPFDGESEETLKTTLQSVINDNLSSRITLKTLQRHIKPVSLADRSAGRFAQPTPRSFHHLRALDVAIYLSEDFSRQLENALAIYASPDWGMEGSVGEIASELEGIITSITTEHAIRHASEFARCRDFAQFTGIIQQQTRLALREALSRILRNVARRVHERVLFSFDQVIMETSKQVLKSEQASDGSEVRAVFKQAREDGLTAAKQIMQQWKLALGRLLNLETDSGVFAAASKTSKSPRSERGNGYFQLPADYDLDTNDLRNRLRRLSQEAITSLTLDGGINPLLRTLPFPPVHINVNYLLNPASVLADRSFSVLYDEHKDGYAAGRADSMTFPGIATFPFDPRDRAQSEDERAKPNALKGPQYWLRGLQDLFSTDDDDVDNTAKPSTQVATKKKQEPSRSSQSSKSGEKEADTDKRLNRPAGKGWGFGRSSTSQKSAAKESAAKSATQKDKDPVSTAPVVAPASKDQVVEEEFEEYEDGDDEEDD